MKEVNGARSLLEQRPENEKSSGTDVLLGLMP